ncbi:MAG TPA: aldose epimerase family protein [Chitinophagaceae bacterium]|nr:aldose epimerase family protein [Chitinophagaceae bacterium]
MPVQQEFCFKNSNGEDIYLFTLTNKHDTTVSITNYGAIITLFKIKMPDGSFNDIVLGFDLVEDYFSESYLNNYAYLGAVCGRYANRIKNGRFTLDGKEYQLTQNMGNDMLHGGKEGFDKKTWQIVSISESGLEFRYLSKDGEEGFPGNLDTIIRFKLTDENELSYEFSATTDKPTAVNLTHHSYFNLNNGLGTIEDHEIKINALYTLAQDEGFVCNGEFIAVKDNMYDFTIFKAINMDWNKTTGYDQCFVIEKRTNELGLVAEARAPQSGITLQIFSNEPAVQFYTGQGLNIPNAKNGIYYKPFSGFCLETHKHPNAINVPHFPNTVLRPGEKYYQKTVYKLLTG